VFTTERARRLRLFKLGLNWQTLEKAMTMTVHGPAALLIGAAVSVSGAVSYVVSITREQPTTVPVRIDPSIAKSQESDDSESLLDERDATPNQILRYKLNSLQRGRRFLETVPSYTVQLTKQEVVHGELLDEQTISLKCRHQPFSVYMLWLTGDAGREVLYVEGANHGKLIGHDGGWKARIPALSLSPTSTLAMRDTRYPASIAGMMGLIDIMSDIHRRDLELSNVADCRLDRTAEFDGRHCNAFTTVYKSGETSPLYRKSITLIDQEWNVPLWSRHYGWPEHATNATGDELDEATLIESYQFAELDLSAHLTDADFDRHNEEYHFR